MTARRWAPIVFGIAVFVVFVVFGLALFGFTWVRDHLTIESTSAATAESAFDEVRRRYAAKVPLLEMEGSVVLRRNPPAPDAPRTTLTTLHVLAWDGREGTLARFEVPFWLLRLKETPIRFGTYAIGLDELQISMTVADLERYGPGVVLDVDRDGERAMLWVN